MDYYTTTQTATPVYRNGKRIKSAETVDQKIVKLRKLLGLNLRQEQHLFALRTKMKRPDLYWAQNFER